MTPGLSNLCGWIHRHTDTHFFKNLGSNFAGCFAEFKRMLAALHWLQALGLASTGCWLGADSLGASIAPRAPSNAAIAASPANWLNFQLLRQATVGISNSEISLNIAISYSPVTSLKSVRLGTRSDFAISQHAKNTIKSRFFRYYSPVTYEIVLIAA